MDNITTIKMRLVSTLEIIDSSPRSLRRCKRLLIRGELIGFPSETVYGLGVNGLNPKAVRKIYDWKGHPLTNPVILHISSVSQLYQLIDVSENEMKAIMILALKFWPGPLTLVIRASSIVPKEVTAGGEFVYQMT